MQRRDRNLVLIVGGLGLALLLGVLFQSTGNRRGDRVVGKGKRSVASESALQSPVSEPGIDDIPVPEERSAGDDSAREEAAAPSDEEPVSAGSASEQDRERLTTSLKKFASRKSYSFRLSYKLSTAEGELLNLTSDGKVKDHKFTHAVTNCAGVQSEVISNGAAMVTRTPGSPEWEEIDTGMESEDAMGGGSDPSAFLELLNSAVMRHVPVENEGNATKNGRSVVALAMPWTQDLSEADDPEGPLTSTGKIRFLVDPKTNDIISWEMDSSVKQADPSQDIRMEIGCDLSGFDEEWAMPVDMPEEMKEEPIGQRP